MTAYQWTKRKLSNPIISAIVSLILGIGVSQFYYHLGKSDMLKAELDRGYKKGMADGAAQQQRAFDEALPQLLEDKYKGALRLSTDAARADGVREGEKKVTDAAYKQGFSEGKTEGDKLGYQRGSQEGTERGLKQGFEQADAICTLQRKNEDYWDVYAELVRDTALWAVSLENDPGAAETERQLMAKARALVDSANTLHDKYAEQSKAFNSIVHDIETAIQNNNYPQLRQAVLVLRESLGIKKMQFLEASQKIMATFEDIRNREKKS